MWWIVRKELRCLLGDVRASVILVALPVVFMAVIGLATSRVFDGASDMTTISVVVVDADASDLSERIVNAVTKRAEFAVRRFDGLADAERELAARGCDAVLVIGPEFSARVAELDPGDVLDTSSGPLAGGLEALDVEVRAQPSLRQTGAIVEGLAFGEVLRECAAHVARENRLTAWFLRNREEDGEVEEDGPPASAPSTASGPSLYQQIVPSYTVLFAFFIVTSMARSFLAERELHTLDRIRVSPLSVTSVLLGKTIPFVGISLFQCTLLLAIGGLLFGMSFGSAPHLLVPVLLSTSFAACGLGLLTAAWVRTDSQVSAYGTLVVLTMGAVSGCMVPREFLPATMQTVSLCVPHAWALEGFHEVLVSSTPRADVVLRCSLAQSAFGIGFLCLGFLLLSRRWSVTRTSGRQTEQTTAG